MAVGGPLVRNKTFWFGDYEGLRDQEGVPRVRQVPTAAEKAGLFSSAVVDPFAAGRPEFSQNAQGQWVIPRDRWDPGRRRHRRADSRSERRRLDDLRVDAGHRHARRISSTCASITRFAPSMTLFGRYSFVDTLTFRPAPLPGLAEGSFNDAFGSNDNRSQGLALGLTWTASPTLVGDFRFGYARGNYYTNPPNFGVDGAAEIGLQERPERSGDRRRRARR